MKLVRNDQNLLLYLHGQLNPVMLWLTARHVARCAQCSKRLAELRSVSAAIAVVIRGDAMPRWKPRTHAGKGALISMIAAAVIIAATAGVVTWRVELRAHARVPISSQPCLPGLPNDSCR